MSATEAKGTRRSKPKPWIHQELLSLLQQPMDYGANAPGETFAVEKVRYLRITDIAEDGSLRATGAKYLAAERADQCLLSAGDLVFARSGATVGKTYLHNSEEPLAFAGYLIRARVDSDRIDPRYLFQFTRSPLYDRWIQRMFRAGAQPNINAEEYGQLLIPLPEIDEQRRIADALSVWDCAIKTAEALVATKQSRASALAAPLVWNDDDPWVSLEEVLTQSATRVGPELSPPIFSVSKEGLSPQEDRFNKRIANEDLSRHMLVLPGQVALSGLNFWLGSVAVSEEPGPICISPDYKVFSLSSLAHACFFKHVVRSRPFRDLLISCSTERASIVRRNFNRELFFASDIPLPAPDIQMKRAAQLETLYQDVRREEQRLEFFRAQKRGLMRKLLTGEWRLKSRASEPAA